VSGIRNFGVLVSGIFVFTKAPFVFRIKFPATTTPPFLATSTIQRWQPISG